MAWDMEEAEEDGVGYSRLEAGMRHDTHVYF